MQLNACSAKKTNQKRMKFATNEEVVPSTSCKKVKHVNLMNLGEKNKQAQKKKTTKNKSSRQIHIQTQKIN